MRNWILQNTNIDMEKYDENLLKELNNMTEEQISEDEIDMLEYPLKHYINPVFRGVLNYRKTILNRTEVEEGVYEYDTPGRYIYLDSEGYAVTYERQKVVDDKVYYKFTDLLDVPEDMAFEFVATLEWKKTKSHDPDYPNEEEEE